MLYRGPMDIMRQKLKGFKDTLVFGLSMLSPSNIRKQIRELKQKTYPELFVGFFKLFFYMFYYTGYFGVYLIKSVRHGTYFFVKKHLLKHFFFVFVKDISSAFYSP
jgi:hypothetical protein